MLVANNRQLLLFFAVLSCFYGMQSFSPRTFSTKNVALSNIKRSKYAVYAREKEVVPEDESEDEQRERLKRKARKMMFNENGVAYAPWVAKQINEEAIIEDLIRKENLQYKKKATSTLDRGEIESSEGMKWRIVNDQVELGWVTGGETENLGYIVEKRPSYGGDFQEIATFNEVTQLQSKGPSGGRYRFVDASTSAGSWIYRVKDCDQSSEQNVLCQCFVEVQTESETKSQSLIAVGFVAFFLVAMGLGYTLDPPR